MRMTGRVLTGKKKLKLLSKRKFAATHNDATATNHQQKQITATNIANASGVERMKREYLQRDSSQWEWGPRRGTPADTRGALEILTINERIPRYIGNFAKLYCIFYPKHCRLKADE
jgi:hypothetical protein